ncbi:hypothetical protein COBT_002549 [Conglomerata obtusa]
MNAKTFIIYILFIQSGKHTNSIDALANLKQAQNNNNKIFHGDISRPVSVITFNPQKFFENDIYRYRRSNEQVDDQNEDEIMEIINKIPNEEKTILLAANLEPYIKGDYAYATKLHAFITMFLPYLSNLSILDIYEPKDENIAEILRLRNMVKLLAKLMCYQKEIINVKNNIISVQENFDPNVDSTSKYLNFLSDLLTKRNNINNDYSYNAILFKKMLGLQKQLKSDSIGLTTYD